VKDIATDVRDIFMVIRAKDQASRVITGLSRSASTDFKRLQTPATLTAQRSAIDMQKVRQNYAQQILHQQKLLSTAMSAGNAERVKFRRSAIRDLGLMRQAEVLSIRQEQIAQKEIMLTARKHAEAKAIARDAKVEAARSAGQWIAVGAGMAIAGAVGVKALHGMAMGAAEFQREATLTLTQVAEVGHSTQELLQISANVATKIGAPYEQMQGALYDIFSSTNVKVKDSQKVLEIFAKAAVAGQVDVQEAGSATISVMNGFHKSVGDLNHIMDVQFAAVRLGRMTYAEFAAAIGKAIPSAVAANQSFETLAGSMAFLTRAGLTAAQAAISFARLSDLFRRSTVPGELRKIGVEAFDASGKMRPINVLLAEMAEKFKPLDATARAELFKKIFGGQGTIQAQRFFNLAINGASELNDYIKGTTGTVDDFGKAYGLMAETTAVKTELLKNNWKEFKRQIGEQATPALNRLLDVGLDILGWLNRLSPGQKRAIATTIAFASVVVGLSGVLIALAGTVKMVGAGISILRLSTSGAIGGLQGLAGASVTARLGLAGLLLTVAALAAVKMKDELKKAADENERFGRTAVVGGKGGQLFADRVSGLNSGVRELDLTMNDARGAMYSSSVASIAAAKAAGGYGASIGMVGREHGRAAPAIQNVIELTEEERKAFHDMAAEIVTSGINGMAARQDKIAEATQRLRDAQADLARVQQGTSASSSSLSSSQERVHDAIVRVEKAQISLRDKTKDSRLEHIRLREAQHDLTRAQAEARTSNGKTAASTDEVRDAVQRVKEAQKALKEATGQTAGEVLQTFKDQAKAAREWSANMRTLISKGMDPDLIIELSREGPEHVQKFVGLSKKKIVDLNKAWRDRNREMGISTQDLADFASGEIAQYSINHGKKVAAAAKAHKEKMVAMERETRRAMIKAGESVAGFRSKANKELGDIDDEPVKVYATAGIQWSKDAATARFRAGRIAEGAKITIGTTSKADDVMAMVSKGETVVSAAHSARPEFQEWAKSMGIKGYADGGLIGRFSGSGLAAMRVRAGKMMDTASRGAGRLTQAQLIRIIEKQTVPFGGGAPGNWGSGSWMRAINELKSDHVPYNIISTFRRGAVTHASGHQSYHALNRAVDLTGPNMLAIWRALIDTNPTELIYSGAPRYKSRRGWSPIGRLDPITLADHWSHVHAAYQQGAMRTREGMAYLHDDEMVLPKRVADPVRVGLSASAPSSASSVVINNTFNNQANPVALSRQMGWELQRVL
jgi:TP901 family phage tail tape measure protein